MMDYQHNIQQPNIQTQPLPMGWKVAQGFNGSIYYIDPAGTTHWEIPREYQNGGSIKKRTNRKKNRTNRTNRKKNRTNRRKKKTNRRKKRTNRRKKRTNRKKRV